MTKEEKAVIVGMYRQGATWEQIALVFGISESYARLIVKEYLAGKK